MLKKKVLLVGINGFIASRLKKYLQSLDEGISIITSSHNGKGADYKINHNNISQYNQALSEVETIIFCPALFKDEGDGMNVNADFPVNLYIEANKAGVSKFIFLSTTLVSGEKTNSEVFDCGFRDSYEDFYSKSKAIAEKKLMTISDQTSLIILRLSHVYSDESHDFRGIFRFIDRLQKLKFIFLPKLEVRKSMLHIDNLSSLVEKIIKSLNVSGTFYVNDGKYYSLCDISRFVSRSNNRSDAVHIFLNPIIFNKLSKKLSPRYPQLQNFSEDLMFSINATLDTFNWHPKPLITDSDE